MGAPLGEWQAGRLPGSPSRGSGAGSPRLGSGGTGRHRPCRATAREVRGCPILIVPAPPDYVPGRGGAYSKPRRGHARRETTRFLSTTTRRPFRIRTVWSSQATWLARGPFRPTPLRLSRAYRAVLDPPNDSRSRAVLPRLRQRARTWSMQCRVARLAERAPESRDAVAAGGSWKRGGLGRAHLGGEGRLNCRLGRALMSCWAGFDPHPAPTPLNNTVSISETRLPYQTRKRTS